MAKMSLSVLDIIADDTHYLSCSNCGTTYCRIIECSVGGDHEAVTIILRCKNGHIFHMVIETYGDSTYINIVADDEINYQDYIKSDKWKEKAEDAKIRAGLKCQVCNTDWDDISLHAHHRTYERLGNEEPEDITVLCAKCHAKFHDLNKKPTRTINKYKVNGN